MTEVTRIMQQIEAGDPQAADQLLPLVYQELKLLAAARLRNEQPGQTLQATELVHEAWLRLVDNGEDFQWNSRGHFFGAAAQAMRRILVDRARARNASKRGGDRQRVELDPAWHPAAEQPEKLLALNEALERFEQIDPARAELVKLRFFAGLTNRQAASAMDISPATADRYWAYARAWLQTEMQIE